MSSLKHIENSEINTRRRRAKLIARAEVLLGHADGIDKKEELILFRSVHACAWAANEGEHTEANTRLRRLIVDHLVNRHLGLIYDMRRRVRIDPSVDADDVHSEGLWTLLQSVVTYDPWRGFAFSTYACRSLLRAYLMLARKNQQIARRINVLKERQKGAEVIHLHDRKLDVQLQVESLKDVLARNAAELTPQERFVVERRWLRQRGESPETLESIGRMIALSRERVRQIQMTALGKLSHALRSRRSVSCP